jgi:hypothetical protein
VATQDRPLPDPRPPLQAGAAKPIRHPCVADQAYRLSRRWQLGQDVAPGRMLPQAGRPAQRSTAAEATIDGMRGVARPRRDAVQQHTRNERGRDADGGLRRMHLVQESSVGAHEASLAPEPPASGQRLPTAVLDPTDIPKGTVKAATARATAVPTPEPTPFDPEDELQVRARRIRSLDASERTRALTELASQIGTAERNRRNGYPAPELAFYERIRSWSPTRWR